MTGLFRFSIDYFYLVSLAMTQRHLISHNAILNRVFQGRIEQYFHSLSLDKSHLYYSFSETTVALDFNDDTSFSVM